METAEVKKEICQYGRMVYERGYVAANDGNISFRISNDEIWITPTGVSKGSMNPDMLVRVNLQGEILEGSGKPSSEIKMHLRVYEENPSLHAVVHTHSPYATAYAIAEQSLEEAIYAETVIMLGVIPCAAYAPPGSQGVPDSMAPFCKEYNCALLARHGAITWGSDLKEAYFRTEALENYCRIYSFLQNIEGGYTQLDQEQVNVLISIREKNGVGTGGIPGRGGRN